MRVGLIDADLLNNTNFPNLALMKLSGYHKELGDEVELLNSFSVDRDSWDIVYLSKVFESSPVDENLLLSKGIFYGGTGFCFDNPPKLAKQIEHHLPDYTLYGDLVEVSKKTRYYFNTSIGFTSRGCFRGCKFCVNQHSKESIKWSSIDEFDVDSNKKICLLDDNILACKDRISILRSLQDTGKKFEYKQGMDIRLMDKEVINILQESPWAGPSYIFAFDDLKDEDKIYGKLEMWMESEPSKHTKVYILTGYKSTDEKDIEDAFRRISILQGLGCLPYIMRYEKEGDINWRDSPYRGMYITLARWCNQPSMFKKTSFREYVHMNKEGSAARRYAEEFEKKYPSIAKTYFDLKWHKFE